MHKRNIFLSTLLGGVLISLASCMPSNQKAIVQSKEKDELSIEEIVDRDMLDNSSDLRKIYNKTARFNGETYKKKIKYYINDENKNVRLYFDDFTINNAYEISDDAERFIVDTFNTIDAYIDLDFERVYSPRKATIRIYKTNRFHDDYEGYFDFQWDDKKLISKIVWYANNDSNYKGYKQKMKDYPTLSYYSAYLVLHEIAHALGLYHLGCEEEWCKNNIDPRDARFDVKDTIMSYNDLPEEYIFLTDLDIEALQEIWGIEKDN